MYNVDITSTQNLDPDLSSLANADGLHSVGYATDAAGDLITCDHDSNPSTPEIPCPVQDQTALTRELQTEQFDVTGVLGSIYVTDWLPASPGAVVLTENLLTGEKEVLYYVPEPQTLLLMLSGLLFMANGLRKKTS
jgi:hypothetical protein